MRINKNIHLFTPENDIRYRAPLNYRGLRIIAWISLVITQASSMILLITPEMTANNHTVSYTFIHTLGTILQYAGDLSVPLFLLANFAFIINSRDKIKKVLLTDLAIAIGMYGMFLFFYFHMAIRLANKFFGETGILLLDEALKTFFSQYLSFNVFIDLTLFAMFAFFMFYEPKKIFTGKAKYVFRSFVAIPIAYEIAGFVLKGLSVGEGIITMPTAVLPLFPSKSLLTFLAFVIITLILKRREILFIRRTTGETRYKEFLDSNVNSLHFSIMVSIVFSIVATIDIIGVLALVIHDILPMSALGVEALASYVPAAIQHAAAWGFSKSYTLFIAIPFILLFSYTKKVSNKMPQLDLLIPIAGIFFMILSWLEGIVTLLMLM